MDVDEFIIFRRTDRESLSPFNTSATMALEFLTSPDKCSKQLHINVNPVFIMSGKPIWYVVEEAAILNYTDIELMSNLCERQTKEEQFFFLGLEGTYCMICIKPTSTVSTLNKRSNLTYNMWYCAIWSLEKLLQATHSLSENKERSTYRKRWSKDW